MDVESIESGLAGGEELLREEEREREQHRLAEEEEWREWEEDWNRQKQEVLELESLTPAPAARVRTRMEEKRLRDERMEMWKNWSKVLRQELQRKEEEELQRLEEKGLHRMNEEERQRTEELRQRTEERRQRTEQCRKLTEKRRRLTEEMQKRREERWKRTEVRRRHRMNEEEWREWEEDWTWEKREQEQESVVVNEDIEEQQPPIGGMEADSTDVANQDTEVLLSSEPEQEPRQELGSFPQAPGARFEDLERRKVDLDKIFVIINFILELPSAVFDQLSSVSKPLFALLGMLMSVAALFICIVELGYKCRKEKVTWKWRGTLPWLYDLSQKPFGSFEDSIGLVCAICQCVAATIAYNFCIRHVDNPIKISIWPIIFAFGLLCSKLLRDHRESRVTRPPV